MVARDVIESYAASREQITSVDLMQASGISYRQLGYWCDNGLLQYEEGRGSGSWRMFAPSEVRVAELLGRLSRCGLLPGSDLARRASKAARRGDTGVISEGPLSVFLA